MIIFKKTEEYTAQPRSRPLSCHRTWAAGSADECSRRGSCLRGASPRVSYSILEQPWRAPTSSKETRKLTMHVRSTIQEIWQFKIRLLRRKIKGWSMNIEAALKKNKQFLISEMDRLDKLAEQQELSHVDNERKKIMWGELRDSNGSGSDRVD
jgi:hypothetical protein